MNFFKMSNIWFYLIEYTLFCGKINGLLSFLFLVVKQMSYFLLLASVSSPFLAEIFIPCFSLLSSKEQRGLRVGDLTGRPQILFIFQIRKQKYSQKSSSSPSENIKFQRPKEQSLIFLYINIIHQNMLANVLQGTKFLYAVTIKISM